MAIEKCANYTNGTCRGISISRNLSQSVNTELGLKGKCEPTVCKYLLKIMEKS